MLARPSSAEDIAVMLWGVGKCQQLNWGLYLLLLLLQPLEPIPERDRSSGKGHTSLFISLGKLKSNITVTFYSIVGTSPTW